MPLYNQNIPQTQAQSQTEVQTQEAKEEPQSSIDNKNKIKISKDFINDIIKGKDVFLYSRKKKVLKEMKKKTFIQMQNYSI